MKTPISQRVEQHRNKLRELGLRPIQLWIPDHSSSTFIKECRRQSQQLLSIEHSKTEHFDSEWIENNMDVTGWK